MPKNGFKKSEGDRMLTREWHIGSLCLILTVVVACIHACWAVEVGKHVALVYGSLIYGDMASNTLSAQMLRAAIWLGSRRWGFMFVLPLAVSALVILLYRRKKEKALRDLLVGSWVLMLVYLFLTSLYYLAALEYFACTP